MSSGTFQRHEVKFLLNRKQRMALELAMQDHMQQDQYGESTICSLYYDTRDFRLIRRSMEKPVYKEKLRLRSYGPAQQDGMVFVELKKKYDMSMIMITHDLGIVAEICDNVAIMYAGGVLEYGSVYDIYKDPQHPYTRALFDSIPDVHRDQERLKVISGLPPDPTDIPAGCPFHPRCPHCTERCKTEKPEAVHLNETHWVKCFLAQGEGGKHHE